LLFIPIIGAAQPNPRQQKQVDSLRYVIKQAKHDSTVVNALVDWDNIIYISDPDMDYELNLKIDSVCVINLQKKLTSKTKNFFLKYRAFALNNIGVILKNQGNYDKSIGYFAKGLKIHELIGDKMGTSATFNNIGNLYLDQNKFSKAIEYYFKSLKIDKELNSKHGIGATLSNIGLVYMDLGDSALDAGNKTLSVEKYEKAINFFRQSLKIQEEIENKRGIAIALNNLGTAYQSLENYSESMDFYKKSLKIREEMDNEKEVAASLLNIGGVYLDLHNYAAALDYSNKAFVIAKKLNAVIEIKDVSRNLAEIYKKLGNYKKSLEMFQLYATVKDSLQSKENEREIIRNELKYNYEKKAAADSVKSAEEKKVTDAQIAQQHAEIRATRNQQYMLFGGLALVVVFAGFMYNRFKVTKKQKKIIEHKERETAHQKEIIEEKQKEIIDSILYARRIQRALLPSQKYLDKNLNNKIKQHENKHEKK